MAESRSEADRSALPAFLEQLLGWYAMTTLVLGERTGLLPTLRLGPGSAGEIARRAGVDERNALSWLRAMVAARHATHEQGVFTLSPQLSAFLGGAFPVDVLAILEFVRRTPEVLGDVEAAIRSGEGVPASRYHAAYGEFMGHVNTPTYRRALVEDWVGGVGRLAERLQQGGRIADIACGDGDAALILARAFPRCEVTGFDADADAITAAGRRADAAAVSNVSFVSANASRLGVRDFFDLAVCLDSWHHLGDTVAVGREVRDILKPGGILVIVESGSSGNVDVDSASPTALIGYAVGLLYCVQESIAAGGRGLTPADGPAWVIEGLHSAGFESVADRISKSGWRIFTATR